LLRFRREATGLDRSQIAAGIGLTLTDVVMIESGQAEAALTAHYFAWLDRIEAWPAEAREFQIAAARAGERFNDA
jgi:hypothetical protein